MDFQTMVKISGAKPLTVAEFRTLAGEIPLHKRISLTAKYIDGGICVETGECIHNFSDAIDPTNQYICPYCLLPLQVVQYKGRTDYGFRHYPGHECSEDYKNRTGDMRKRPGSKRQFNFKSLKSSGFDTEAYQRALRNLQKLKANVNISERMSYAKTPTLFTYKYGADMLMPNFCACPECDNTNVYIKFKTGPVTSAVCNNISSHKTLSPVKFIPVNTRGISVRAAQTKSLEELNEDKMLFVIKEGYDREGEPKHYYLVDELAPPIPKYMQSEFPLMSTIPSVDIATLFTSDRYQLAYDYAKLGGAIGLSRINWDIPDSYKLLSTLYKERELYLKELKHEKMVE